MTVAAPTLATEAALAGSYPSNRFNQRERRLLESVLEYLNAGIATTQIAAGAVTLAKLATGITPAYIAKFGGTAAVTSAATSQAITVTGAAAGDLVMAQMNTADSSARLVSVAIASTNTVTLTYSGTTGTGGNVSYVVWRAAS